VKPSLFLFASLIITIFIYQKQIQAALYSNLGAVQLAQVQLRGWPNHKITSEELLSQISPAENSFKQAIKLQSNQPTANYRVGLIATEQQDFIKSNFHLSTAFDQRPFHRGIRKALGFSFAWIGETTTASKILSPIPEAPYELGIYSQYWQSENRMDLSMYASETKNMLEH
jgi:hypothetical protein